MPRPQGTPLGRKLATTAKAVGSAFNAALAGEGGWPGPRVADPQLDQARADGRPSSSSRARSKIEGPTLTRHLDNLEENGLVERQRSESDRRAFRVELTPAGEAAYEGMLEAVIAFNKRLVAGLTPS